MGTVDTKFGIEDLRSFHAINCGITKFASFEVFEAAGASLKKVNLSYNKLNDIPSKLSEACPNLQQLVVAHNSIMRMPNNLDLLSKLAELDLSNN